MGEISDFMTLYIKDMDTLEKETDKLTKLLENKIKMEAPYKEGRLKRSIRVVSEVEEDHAVIIGTWDEGVAPHGIFVLAGHYTRGRKSKVPPNDFLGRGLEGALEAYK